MNKSMLILVQPQHFSEDEEEWVGATQDEAELHRRWDEYKRLRKLLLELGMEMQNPSHSGGIAFNADGLNWRGKMTGDIFYITDKALSLLEGKAKELAELKKKALSKLSPEEQYALGLIEKLPNPPPSYLLD